MPQIKIRGINENDICKISEKMINDLVEAVKYPRDYFEIECIKSVAIRNGKIADVYPFVEVAWFDRGQEVQDIVARIITDSIRNNLDVESMDLAFTVFEKEKYYENGEHF
ncbi:TPA: DUF1904 domain-containing protein [Clostridioides difficile]|uniref:DUF1904 domain-containing protein n=1 Tax=Clostridioides difficile TaxID=1496 RepID=UPI00038C959F|nr:DUF1904 domain-containing protein [Clostridioides difficile]EQG77489.1 hypothetical protein QKA_1475 [Clostridioides difficile DA00165]EAA0009294.1 DUF1904 domain-containing protein [Clostridioides difficile]EGT3777947.1 DUF1904 domain-containing protein [Clostridioides difficile]EGT3820011.1 DUF1904 domain-containing protein [Clostridioides difficile]EGT3856343.1 DUF1904 domain-containing protein [Clostridioides difficile]